MAERRVPEDTDPAARRAQVAQWRAMSPSERARAADRLSADVTRLAVAGIVARQPTATALDVHVELTRRRYGVEVARLLVEQGGVGR